MSFENNNWYLCVPGGAASNAVKQYNKAREEVHKAWVKVATDRGGHKDITVFYSEDNGRFTQWGGHVPDITTLEGRNKEGSPRKRGRTPREMELLSQVWEELDAHVMPTQGDLFTALTGVKGGGFHKVVGQAGHYLRMQRLRAGYAYVGLKLFVTLPKPLEGCAPWTVEGAEPCRYSDYVRAQEEEAASVEAIVKGGVRPVEGLGEVG